MIFSIWLFISLNSLIDSTLTASGFWILFIYCPVAHWLWGGGFLSNQGELDFAGGTVIHVNAGVAGLVLSLMLGKRKDFNFHSSKPSSIKLTVLGSALLLFGWFGFNAGSEFAANFVSANALLVTCISACAGGLSWLFTESMDVKKPTLIGLASGVISGLVAITPAAGYVGPSSSVIIGIFISVETDVPSGPSIIVVSAVLFFISHFFVKFLKKE